jgi:cytochrome c-type biogenesis protein CcmF
MFGNILLTLALIASVFTIVMYYYTNKGYTNTLKFARIGYHTMAIMIIAASALLLHAILTHAYEYKYVYNYSGSDLSTGLLMSTFWAGQEGSFMLWLLFTAITGLILLEYTSKRGDLENRVMMMFTLSLTFLLIMVNPLLKNPFSYIWTEPVFIDIKNIKQSLLSLPFLQSFVFEDTQNGTSFIQMNSDLHGLLTANGIAIKEFIIQGKGLNPLLQNFWMQIHPPILFVGFAMSTVPFAFALSALMSNEYKDWVKQSLPWVLSGAMVLGLAIMLGGYWAYGVLGWGGYWGWDPVENSSLVPWIVGVASIHTLLVQQKTQKEGGAGRFVKTNLILCIMTYVMVLYSTFLTRSGILSDASVHSFVAPGRVVFLLLLGFILSFTFIGFGSLAYRWKYLNATFVKEENILSRELALFTGSVVLIASAIIILAGTSAPIFGTAVELTFYNELNLPIAIIIGLLNGFSLLIKWKFSDGKEIIKNSRNSIVGTLIVTLAIVIIGGVYDLMDVLLTFAAAFTLVVNAEVSFKIFMGRKTYLGGYIAHIGIALFMLGVVATGGFSESKQIELIKGEPKEVFGREITFTGWAPFDNGKKYHFNLDIKDGNDIETIKPVMFIAEFNNSLMREPDILSSFTRDFYVSPVSYDEGKAGAHDHANSASATLTKGQGFMYENTSITFTKFNFPPDAMQAMQEGMEFKIGAQLLIKHNEKEYSVEPKMITKEGNRTFESVEVKEANLLIEMKNLDAGGTVNLVFSKLDAAGEKETETNFEGKREILTIDASIKPFINLVWLGVILVTAGFVISTIRRSKESRA